MYYLNVDRFGNEILNGGGAPDFNPTPINYTPTASGNTQNLNSFVIDPNGDIYFIDEQGDSFLVNTAQTVTNITNTVTGHKIGTYTNEQGVAVDINETVTVLGDLTYNAVTGLLTIPYTDEAGVVNNKTVTIASLNVLTTVQPTPTATGNTTNLNSAFKDASGNTWIVDANGDAVLAGSAPFKNLNEFHVDPNGNDTTGDGSQENPFKTITKAVSVAGQGDEIIVHAGVYNENVTLSTPNVALVAAQSEYGSLTQINGTVAVTANGTSVKVGDIGILGAVTHTGTAPLYISNSTLSSTFTSSSAAYVELKNSSVQDGAITKSAGSMLIENSKIDNVSVSGAGTALLVRDSYQDALSTISYGAGTVYSINNVVGGDVNIAAGANALEDAALAQGVPLEFAKEAETSDFMKLGMINPDYEANPTKIVTYDEVTGRLEISEFQSAEIETTSITPVVYDGTGYVSAQADVEENLADLVQLSDGTRIHDGKVIWPSHGLTVGSWYYLDQANPGVLVEGHEATGWAQQILFVEDANTVHVDIEEGWNYSNDGGTAQPDYSQTVYVNATSPSTATIFDLNNPPTTNNDALKADVNNIYIGTDGSTWTYNSTTGTYSTYVYPTTVPNGFFAQMVQGTSVANSTLTMPTYSTVNNTAGSSWNPATGTFTAPKSGWYDVSANLLFTASSWNANSQSGVVLQKNGATVVTGSSFAAVAITNNYIPSAIISTKQYLNSGDTLRLQLFQNSGSAKATHTAVANTFSVVEIR